MKVKVTGWRVLAGHVAVLAGFSLIQGCASTPKDQSVIMPPGPVISDAGLMPVDVPMTGSEKPAASASKVHRVEKGETLSAIASSYGTSWKTLADYNNLSNPNVLSVGQEVMIPDSLGAAAPVKKKTPVSSRPASSSIKQGSSYTIQKGDSLGSIAKRSGLTVKEIKLANNLKNDSIVAGKKLSIPRKGEVKAPAVAKAPAAVKDVPTATSAPVAPAAAVAVPDSALPPPAPIADAAPVAVPAVDAVPIDGAAPSAGVTTSPDGTSLRTHTLYPGETLEQVASQYGCSLQEIMTLNNITDPASVKVGSKVLVPDME